MGWFAEPADPAELQSNDSGDRWIVAVALNGIPRDSSRRGPRRATRAPSRRAGAPSKAPRRARWAAAGTSRLGGATWTRAEHGMRHQECARPVAWERRASSLRNQGESIRQE